MENLNELHVDNDGSYPDHFEDNFVHVSNATVSIFFRKQKEKLIQKINEYNCIIGCVAWLTDFDILSTLAKVSTVAIVVQKEDFLRPDIDSGNNWKLKLRQHYDALKNLDERHMWPGLIGKLSVASDLG